MKRRLGIMIKKTLGLILFLVYGMLILSCTKTQTETKMDSFTNMNILLSTYYLKKLSLLKINEKKIVEEERLILDLSDLPSSRIFQAGFLDSNTVYVVFYGEGETVMEFKYYIRFYDTVSFNWEDVIYRSEHNDIEVIDIENSGGGYYAGYNGRNELYYFNFTDQTSSLVFTFPKGEHISTIDCHFSDTVILVNTLLNPYTANEKALQFHYYFIDKHSYEKVAEGDGRLFVNKYSDSIVCEKEAKLYILDDLFYPTKELEIPMRKNTYFYNAIALDENSYIFRFYTKTPRYLMDFLFAGEHFIENYDYRVIQVVNEEEPRLRNEKLYKYFNAYIHKELFDALPSEGF